VVENLEEMIFVVNREYRYVIVNRAFLSRWGMTKDQVVGRLVAEVLDPDVFKSVVKHKLDECFQGKVVNYEITYKYAETGERDISVTYLPVEGSAGIDRVVCVLRDITERKRAEEALRESEARERARAKELETVLEAVPVPVCIAHDAECRQMTGNPAAYEHLRVPAGKNFSKSADPEEQPPFRLMRDGVEIPPHLLPMQQAAAAGKPVYGRALTMVFEDGTERETVVTAVPLLDEEGKTRGVVGASIDLTELKQAEKALRESEMRFRAVYERSPVGITLLDSRTGRFLQANPKFCEIAGRSEEELLRIDVGSITHADDVEHGSEYLQQLAEEKLAHYEMDKRYLRPDGSVRWVRILVVPMWSKGDKQRWHMALVQDITERRQAEEALRESEARERARAKDLETVLAAVPVPIYITHDADCRWMTGNQAAYDQMRVPAGENMSKSAPPAEQPRFRLMHNGVEVPTHLLPMQQAVATGKPVYERPLTTVFEDGSERETVVNAVPLLDETGKARGVVASLIDLTERNEAEKALRESEERFRVALKNSPITVFNLDRDLRYTWLHNSQLPEPSSYLGKTLSEFVSRVEGERVAEIRRRVLETGVGVRHQVELGEGGRKRYYDTTIEPVLDSSGAVIGLTGASMDVTEFREASEALRVAKKRLTEEKLYLEQEIDTELGFGEIIGQSKALQAVMQQVGKVAASDATVLLLGETGTGKELVARAIHRLSQRVDNSFIKLNCAAIPSGLLESELFGNEKGAFTGAVSRKIGRLELADKGTLFLDEIGEISLALQPKLLRVLQDQEFERLGGIQTLKVDFRLIAATNRDLADVVRQNEFRSDLYYRLNVFPIRLPPLRERRDDIQMLVEHFVQKCARRMNKSITSIPKRTMDGLIAWEWPGNVRELENFIERSVILTQGSVLVSPLSELAQIGTEEKSVDETLEAKERDYILRALRESHGQIGGPKGAAMRLGLKRTTLQSKMKHFGINPRRKRLEQ
jgi:PAS domain S-box-containing protein